MFNSKYLIFLNLSCCLILSCSNVKYRLAINREYDYVKNCREKWNFLDLDEKKELKVLLIQKKVFWHIGTKPNFIIGLTNIGETIAILDKDNNGTDSLKVNDSIIIEPAKWSVEDKENFIPAFIVYKKYTENDLLCKVKYVYYGKISVSK